MPMVLYELDIGIEFVLLKFHTKILSSIVDNSQVRFLHKRMDELSQGLIFRLRDKGKKRSVSFSERERTPAAIESLEDQR